MLPDAELLQHRIPDESEAQDETTIITALVLLVFTNHSIEDLENE